MNYDEIRESLERRISICDMYLEPKSTLEGELAKEIAQHAKVPFEILRSFRDCVSCGEIPPAHILTDIALRLSRYFDSQWDDITLDHVFDLRGRQGRYGGGNAKVRERRNRLRMAHLREMYILIRIEKKSQKAAAGEIINRFNLDINESALIKDYSKRKIEESFDAVTDSLSSVFTPDEFLELLR